MWTGSNDDMHRGVEAGRLRVSHDALCFVSTPFTVQLAKINESLQQGECCHAQLAVITEHIHVAGSRRMHG